MYKEKGALEGELVQVGSRSGFIPSASPEPPSEGIRLGFIQIKLRTIKERQSTQGDHLDHIKKMMSYALKAFGTDTLALSPFIEPDVDFTFSKGKHVAPVVYSRSKKAKK